MKKKINSNTNEFLFLASSFGNVFLQPKMKTMTKFQFFHLSFFINFLKLMS